MIAFITIYLYKPVTTPGPGVGLLFPQLGIEVLNKTIHPKSVYDLMSIGSQ